MQPLFDAGVNLFSPSFAENREQIVLDAWQNGLSGLLLISSDIKESQQQQQFALTDPRLYCTAGVHPHQASQVEPDWLSLLTQMLHLPQVVAVGECGLDFNRNFSAPEQQIKVFEAQLQLAISHKKPVYLHERDAFECQLDMLNRYPGLTGVAHCFTGDKTQLQAYLDLGLYIGITGWLCDQSRGMDLMDAVRYLPLDRLILETDSPFLLPKTMRNKPKSRINQPAFLVEIAAELSRLTGHSLDDIAFNSKKNSLNLFQITADEYAL